MTTWHVLAAEFPPDRGGIGAHTHDLSRELSARGQSIFVWTSRDERWRETRLEVNGERDRWTKAGLARLGARLDIHPSPRRLLVPYAPNVFGRRGLNFEVCHWLQRRAARGDELHLLVHEPFYPWRLLDKPTRWVLALAHRRMMRRLLDASARVYVSTMAWEPMLSELAGRSLEVTLVPSSANIPFAVSADLQSVRRRFARGATTTVIGTFGASVPLTRRLFQTLVPSVVSRSCAWIFIGDGSNDLANAVVSRRSDIASFVHATGTLRAEEVSTCLQACDLTVQPYQDGITTRRTTLMACLAHGLPTITTDGPLSEPIWREEQPVRLVEYSAVALERVVRDLIADESARTTLSRRARQVYVERFGISQAAASFAGNSSLVHA
jgi:glycosyltransferase involved in cell wall biosynthesis